MNGRQIFLGIFSAMKRSNSNTCHRKKWFWIMVKWESVWYVEVFVLQPKRCKYICFWMERIVHADTMTEIVIESSSFLKIWMICLWPPYFHEWKKSDIKTVEMEENDAAPDNSALTHWHCFDDAFPSLPPFFPSFLPPFFPSFLPSLPPSFLPFFLNSNRE